MSASLIGHWCQAPRFQRLLSTLHGSRFYPWSALRWVKAATSIGRIGLENFALGQVADVRVGPSLFRAKIATPLCNIAGRLSMRKTAPAAVNFLLYFVHLFAPPRLLGNRKGVRQIRI